MDDSPRIPTLTDIKLLPRWAKVLFLSRCAARVIPLIQSQWPTLTAVDMRSIGMAGGNAQASAFLGREVLVGADPLPRLLELIKVAEEQNNLAGFGLSVCANAAGLTQIENAEMATSFIGQTLEAMIQAYAATGLNEGAVVGSIWFDYMALRDATRGKGWSDETSMKDDVLREFWPHGTPPGWPAS